MHKLLGRANRDLFWALCRSQLKLSDYRSGLGILWSFLGPLLKAGVFYLIFHQVWGRTVSHFGLKILVGVVALQYFLSVVQYSQQGVRSGQRAALNSAVPFEILVFPIYAVPTLKLIVELTLCWLVAVFTAGAGAVELVRTLAVCVLLLIFSIGTGLLIASLQSLARDITEIWQHLSPLILFLTPVFYPLDQLPAGAADLVRAYNPLCPLVLILKESITGTSVHGGGAAAWQAAAAWSAGLFIVGYWTFRKLEKELIENL